MAHFDDNDEDFGFDDEDFNPEEVRREFERERERVENMPIMQKARELFEIVDSLMVLIDEDDEFLAPYRAMLFEDAGVIAAKISSAEASDLYTIRMENAVLIKIHARNLIAHTFGLEMMEFKEVRYLDVLRDTLEEFRVLFIEWVNSFDKDNDSPSAGEWGDLFR